MKAVISRGKDKGRVVKINQWCNDWFTTDTGTMLDVKPRSPLSLVFTLEGINEIRAHKNNGMLFSWFEVGMSNATYNGKKGEVYQWTFKRRRQ